ncbi:hypothetical protein BGY98DRAFT_537031 [Russula aff. rugulosa BPL654]|nr:hypothetical protein BGY98DRAFT_537031 [Russula aff. rugulosa BPL654]
MEDLILVTGCTLVTSWAAAAFDGLMSVDSDAPTISLEARESDGGGDQFVWRNIRGNVEYHSSRFDPNVQGPQPQNQCVFIRGFRAKRSFFGPDEYGLLQNPFLTTLTTVGRMRYKCHRFQMAQR